MRESFEEHLAVTATAWDVLERPLTAAVAASRASFLAGHQLLALGNGGSAAQAQHFAAELVGRYQQTRPPLAALALGTDSVAASAMANDFGFEEALARQVEALVHPGDVVLAISTSGTSPNVVRALARARDSGAVTVAMTGEGGGDLAALADHLLAVPSPRVPRVQEVHTVLLHLWAEELERTVTDR